MLYAAVVAPVLRLCTALQLLPLLFGLLRLAQDAGEHRSGIATGDSN